MQYAATFGFPVWLRAAGPLRSRKDGVAHDGEVATRLGLPAIPVVRRDHRAAHHRCELVRATGARVHLCRLSTRGRRRDGARGEDARACRSPATSASTTCTCREMDIGYFDAHCRLEPPLRIAARPRRAARRRSPTAPSTRSCSDHTPVDEDAKQLPFAEAEPGATGLELLLPLTLKWGAAKRSCRWRRRWRASPAIRRASSAWTPGRIEPRGAAPTSAVRSASEHWRVVPAALQEPGQEHAVPRLRARRARARDDRRRQRGVRGLGFFLDSAQNGPRARQSMRSSASACTAFSGKHTIGSSCTLKDVFRTSGIPERCAVGFDQAPVKRVGRARHGLRPRGAVHVDDRRDARPPSLLHVAGDGHERQAVAMISRRRRKSPPRALAARSARTA